jgi:hypothetical protein
MKRLQQLHRKRELERGRRIWKGMAQLANADLVADKKFLEELPALILRCSDWTVAEGERLRGFSEVVRYSEEQNESREEAVQFWARYYQNEFRSLLTWLTAPDKHSQLRVKAIEFLNIYGHGIRWNLDDEPDTNLDESSAAYFPVLYQRWVEYDSIMSPVCEFILDQIERFHSGDQYAEAIPLRLCQRPECGKFIVPERTGRKRFCSDLCCALFYENKKPREERTDYAWLHRLEADSLPVLRKKLKKLSVKQRLREIQTKWPNLAKKVKGIRERV